MALVNHRIISILCEREHAEEGGGFWLRHRRGQVERGANLTEGGTHSELMHSNVFAMKPMY
jgi:hypothetical protein